MRSNAMKTCAVGAMLIGVTLGATQVASAGVTWLSEFGPSGSTRQSQNYAMFGTTELTTSGANALLADGGMDGANSVIYSPTTSSGFTIGVSASDFFAEATRVFSVSDLVGASLSVSLPGGTPLSEVTYAITRWDGSQWLDIAQGSSNGLPAASLSWSGNLAAGTYAVNVGGISVGAFEGTMVSFVVPAPGAAALVGLAGLVGTRRRHT